MYLPKLSNNEIGCYHTPAAPPLVTSTRDDQNGAKTQMKQHIDPAALQSDCAAILAQVAQLEAVQAEFGTICGRLRESIRSMSVNN